jgi:ribose transport system ATP-binding protein
VRWKEVSRSVADLFDRLEIPVDPTVLAGKLSPAERALVALAIAFSGIESAGSNVLILDEATASLPETDAGHFLERVRVLARAGMAVLMVTHRISEIPLVADTVTVLANGRVVHRGASADVDEEFIIAKMVGRAAAAGEEGAAAPRTSIEKLWEASGRPPIEMGAQRIVLEVEHLSGDGLRDVSFEVRAGEIIGITGLSSSGVTQLPYVLAGSLDRESGTIRVNGRELPKQMTPRLAMHAGVALVPADRLRQGGVRSLSVRDNIVLPDADRYWRNGARERAVIGAAIDELDIQPTMPSALFERLSGGNQQKVVLSKWLLVQPAVLVLDDPTSGVDPRSRRLVFDAVRAAARSGLAVILLSSEHEQLVATCSRVLVLRSGTIAAQLGGAELTREALARWSYV